jgi:drug/metabolite transporter (DMT)-like permease
MSSASVPALGVFGLCGILGFSSFICNRRSLDEREELIDRRATMLGMTLFWQVFVLSSMGVWAIFSYVRHQTTVPVGFFPFLVWVGFIVFSVTQSVATLVQYRRSANDDAL